MREHVVQQMDKNNDRMISQQEFLAVSPFPSSKGMPFCQNALKLLCSKTELTFFIAGHGSADAGQRPRMEGSRRRAGRICRVH